MNLNPLKWFAKKDLTLDAMLARLASTQNTVSAIRITPETALKAPTMWAVVNVISRSIAMLPFCVETETLKGGKLSVEKDTDHNVSRILNIRPNAWQTPYEYWMLLVLRLLLYGNAYSIIHKARNERIVRLQPVHPNMVTVKADKGELTYTITDTESGSTEYPAEEIHHIKGLSLDGLVGLSPVAQIREAIAMEIAAEEFGATVFGSGAIPNVILKREGHFKDQESIDKFTASWNRAFKRRRGTAVLEDGMTFEMAQMTNEDSQFLETRKYQRTVIAGAYGVPPNKIGDLERATFSNIEHQGLDFVNNTLTPWLECIEGAVARDLLTMKDAANGTIGRFSTTRLLRADAKSRSESLKIMREWGIINANEWRAREGLSARKDPAGQDYLVPLNFTNGDESVGGPDKPPVAPPPKPGNGEDDDGTLNTEPTV